MSVKHGTMVRCDRCGEWTFYPDDEPGVNPNSIDGRRDLGWYAHNAEGLGELCARCDGEFRNVVQHFKSRTQIIKTEE